MRALPIRVRLTAWYLTVMSVTFLASSVGMYVGMRASIHATVDKALATRLQGIQNFLLQYPQVHTSRELRDLFVEHSGVRLGGELYQVLDSQGVWVYRTPTMPRMDIPSEAPRPHSGLHYNTIHREENELRWLSSTVEKSGQDYSVQLVSFVNPFYHILDRFRWIAVSIFPIVILISGVGGYWLSGRAMRPVYDIAKTARSISEQNLSSRLTIPEARDELRVLSETLNDMLGRLDLAFKKITQFTADASHDLRTPIAMIRTTAELILQKRRSPEEYEELVRDILVEAEATGDLIENLLMLARSDAHSMELSRSIVDLSELVREEGSSAASLAQSHNLSLAVSAPDHSVLVYADRQALRRLMWILLDNATKFTPYGGSISLLLKSTATSAVLEVTDSGAGISPQDLPHIFERFYRADKSREMNGAGLGLSIAKWIADAHQASIEVESTLEKCSLFRVTLPLSETIQPLVIAAQSPGSRA